VTTSPPSFPVNATVALDRIHFLIDLGQSIGTTDLEVRGLRLSNRKCSECHHGVFINLDSAQAESKGRFSGYMRAEKFRMQTSIYFPTIAVVETPIVQIDVRLGYLEFRASFEYHVFLIGDSRELRFTIYNRRVRQVEDKASDRLVFLGDSKLIQLYATAEGPTLVLALYNAVIQLQEEKERNRIQELGNFLGRRMTVPSPRQRPSQELIPLWQQESGKVDMEMSIKFLKINIGIFKAALNDSPVFRVNVADIRALFSQIVTRGSLENQLLLSLGNLGIALSPLKRMSGKELAEMEVENWVRHVSNMKGGVILAVPETEGSMYTKHDPHSDVVQHIFKSRLDGKVDIGWNYGSVMYVQDLWKTFEQKLEQGSRARMTSLPTAETEGVTEGVVASTGQDIEGETSAKAVTAQTPRYTYVALEPAIIETPQLRQMGEATPPMEWIGVNRMRLPVFTHQAFIVPLQKVSRRVENLYTITLQRGGS
jgi:protein CSF1